MLKFLVAILLLGVAIYLVVRLLERARRGRGGSGGFGPQLRKPQPPRGPLGPDDDPDFLRDLNRRRPKPKRPGPDGPPDS